MGERFLSEIMTPEVFAAQERYYGRRYAFSRGVEPDALGAEEIDFIARRDSFYLATVTSSGWPYIQHRGGPAGFLQVVDPHSLAFADFRGNRQLASTGNLAGADRVALFLMDYAQRKRLKILGRARVIDAREPPALADDLGLPPALRRRVERVFTIEVVGFDWNCPAYITPRYSQAEVDEHVQPLRERIAALERDLEDARRSDAGQRRSGEGPGAAASWPKGV
jgi:predicted pyridoxine 5'-phosphate oxidase superfamily flavin-nucleotide-binding protein